MPTNYKNNCYSNIAFTEKPSGRIVIGSISLTFERLVTWGGLKIFSISVAPFYNQ